MEHRFIRKTFACDNCNKRFKKLVNYQETITSCDLCNAQGARTIEASEFNREEADRTYRLSFDHSNGNYERQFHPRTDLFDRDPSNLYADARRRRTQRHYTRNDLQNGFRNERSTTTEQNQLQPRRFVYGQFFIPYRISPFNGSVRRQPIDILFNNGYFDIFPQNNLEFFMDNFASNFSSNFNDPLSRLIFIQSMQNQPSGNPPASKDILKKLKKFKMNEEYCKKSESGKFEYPSCSVCLTEINKEEDTILISCGHLFHDPCIIKWLQVHNTCPVCRYELPTDDIEYEKMRQERNNNNNNTSHN